MLHDIRTTGTVNLRETINLNFHSEIILPTVYFPFSTSSHPEFEGPRHHIPSLHISGEAPGNECTSHLHHL